MTFPSAGQGEDENIRIRLIADLQQYMQAFEAAGRPIEDLIAIIQGVANQTGVMGEQATRTIQDLNASWDQQQDILEKNRQEIVAIQQILSEGVRRDPRFNLQERINVLREENKIHIENNNARERALRTVNEIYSAGVQYKDLLKEQKRALQEAFDVLDALGVEADDVFKPENITAAKNEFNAMTKRVAVFGEQSGEVWETFNAQMGRVSERAIVFRQQVDFIKERILSMRAANQPLQDLKQGFMDINGESRFISSGVIQQAFRETADAEREADAALKEYLNTIQRTGQNWGEQPLRQAGDAARGLAGVFQNLNQVAKVFFGISLFSIGQRALSAINRLIRESVEAGVAWSRTMFNMGTAVRALQRTGVEVTIAEMNEQVTRLSETFGFFTTRQLQEGIAQIALLTRNVGLTKDEIFNLSEATATLAIITGKDFAEQGLLVARSIASGYTEALQRAGIAANRLAIQEQALRMGIEKTFMQMTEQERAAVTLELVLEQVAAVSEDVGDFQETLAGKMQQVNVQMQEQKDIMGKELAPIALFWKQFVAGLQWGLTQIVKGIRWLFDRNVATAAATIITMMTLWELFINDFSQLMQTGAKDIVNIWRQARNEMIEVMEGFGDDMGSDVSSADFGLFPLADSIRDEMEEAEDNLEQGMKKMMDIVLDYHRAMEDAWIKHQDKLKDIATKLGRSLEKVRIDLLAKRAEIERETQDKLFEANQEYRLQELKAEEDFLEKMTQLRERLIFDLEEAVRERDARQVLRLIREFNLKQTQMTREEELARMQRERDFQAELADIARQREIRLRELAIETRLRREELLRRYEQERDDANLDYEREQRDIEKRKDRRLADLKAAFEDEMKIRLDHSAEVLLLAADTARKFRDIWAQTFGFVGDMFGDLDVPVVRFTGLSSTDKIPYSGGNRATGGTVVARRPTTVLMGERGAEAATFTPLHRVGVDQDRIFGGNLPGSRDKSSSALVRVMLAEGLKAEIVRQAMDQTADVIIEEMRR